jgi:hypothetical protein
VFCLLSLRWERVSTGKRPSRGPSRFLQRGRGPCNEQPWVHRWPDRLRRQRQMFVRPTLLHARRNDDGDHPNGRSISPSRPDSVSFRPIGRWACVCRESCECGPFGSRRHNPGRGAANVFHGDDVVQQFTPTTTNPSLGDPILPGSPFSSANVLAGRSSGASFGARGLGADMPREDPERPGSRRILAGPVIGLAFGCAPQILHPDTMVLILQDMTMCDAERSCLPHRLALRT